LSSWAFTNVLHLEVIYRKKQLYSYMRKGQMEVVVVLGVLLVVVVAVFYAMQGGKVLPSNVPEGIYKQQREVATSVKNVIRDATDETLKAMMAHGGYLDRDLPGVTKTYHDVEHVDFLLGGVPYWQRCSRVMYPSMEEIKVWMERSIEDIVKEGLSGVEEQYGNLTSFEKERTRVSVDIKGDDPFEPDIIEVTVSLPTTVKGHALPEGDLHPYRVSFRTKFGRIYAFGKDFADASSVDRYFDVFSIAAIYFSQELENTHVKLPTQGVMTQCGEVVYRSPTQINSFLLEILQYVMTSTLWWQKMEPASDETKVFAIEDLNGERYAELDIKTVLADDWVFNLFDFVFETNFEMPQHGGYTVPICTASYNHAYNFNYPFILRIRDTYTGYSFNLASEVGVRDRGDEIMEPSDCSLPGVKQDECSNLACSGEVEVMSDEGVPLEDAWVVFGDCPIGQTDRNGLVKGKVKCGMHKLFVYQDPSYEFFVRNVTATELSNAYTVMLNPVSRIKIHFREINVTRQGYRTENGQQVLTSCDGCSRGCGIEKEVSHQCDIEFINREYSVVEFDNGNIGLPVTNMDASGGAASGCSNTTECEFCRNNAQGVEAATEELRNQVLAACRACAAACYTPPVESTFVDYLPSGYSYSIEGKMYDTLNDYLVNGYFLQDGFFLEKNVTELFIYIPRRSGDRRGYTDFEVGESENSCLLASIQKCGLSTISAERQPSTTIVLPAEFCTCEYLKSLTYTCKASKPSLFCQCPEGGSYPGDCGDSCGSGEDPPCTECCNRAEVLEYLRGLEESCKLRVICSLV
jgi:hypothetical protein